MGHDRARRLSNLQMLGVDGDQLALGPKLRLLDELTAGMGVEDVDRTIALIRSSPPAARSSWSTTTCTSLARSPTR